MATIIVIILGVLIFIFGEISLTDSKNQSKSKQSKWIETKEFYATGQPLLESELEVYFRSALQLYAFQNGVRAELDSISRQIYQSDKIMHYLRSFNNGQMIPSPKNLVIVINDSSAFMFSKGTKIGAAVIVSYEILQIINPVTRSLLMRKGSQDEIINDIQKLIV